MRKEEQKALSKMIKLINSQILYYRKHEGLMPEDCMKSFNAILVELENCLENDKPVTNELIRLSEELAATIEKSVSDKKEPELLPAGTYVLYYSAGENDYDRKEDGTLWVVRRILNNSSYSYELHRPGDEEDCFNAMPKEVVRACGPKTLDGFRWRTYKNMSWYESPGGIPWCFYDTTKAAEITDQFGASTTLENFISRKEREVAMALTADRISYDYGKLIADDFELEIKKRKVTPCEDVAQYILCEKEYLIPLKDGKTYPITLTCNHNNSSGTDIIKAKCEKGIRVVEYQEDDSCSTVTSIIRLLKDIPVDMTKDPNISDRLKMMMIGNAAIMESQEPYSNGMWDIEKISQEWSQLKSSLSRDDNILEVPLGNGDSIYAKKCPDTEYPGIFLFHGEVGGFERSSCLLERTPEGEVRLIVWGPGEDGKDPDYMIEM